MLNFVKVIYRFRFIFSTVRKPIVFFYTSLLIVFLLFQNCARYSLDTNVSDLESKQPKRIIPRVISDQIKRNFPCVDGSIYSVSVFNDIAYLAGRFTTVGHCRGHGVVFNGITAHSENSNAQINNEVKIAIPDENGGWYIGGKFTKIDGINRIGLAHIFADGQFDNGFDLHLNGEITSLLQNGDELFLSGSFTVVAGKTVPYLAIYNLKSKTVKDWSTKLAGPIKAMTITSSTLIIGGHFSKQDVEVQGGAAMVNTSSGSLLYEKKFPLVAGSINASISDGQGGWFIGGTFTAVGSKHVSNLAHILNDYTVDPNWQGETNDSVTGLYLDSGKLFVGGFFNQVNSAERKLIAALDASNGSLLGWDAKIKDGLFVKTIVGEGNLIFIGGDFEGVGTKANRALAAVNKTSGLASDWNPKLTLIDINPSDAVPNYPNVTDIQIYNSKIFIGGQFDGLDDSNGTKVRHNFVLIDLADFKIQDFDPSPYDAPNASVSKIQIIDNDLIIGGYFNSIKASGNANSRKSLAVFNLSDLSLKPLALDTSMSIRTFTVHGSDIIFSSSNGIYKINRTAGTVSPLPIDFQNPDGFFNIAMINHIQSYATDKLLIGGNFKSIGGVARNNLAAIDLTTGSLSDWIIDANNEVYALTATETQLYIGGIFTQINETSRQYIAAIDLTTKNLDPRWSIHMDNVVEDLRIYNSDQLFIAGRFNRIFENSISFTRNYIALVDLDPANFGKLTNWDAQITERNYGVVNSISLDKNAIYLAGIFDIINNNTQYNIAKLSLDNASLIDWAPQLKRATYFSDGLNFIGVNGTKVFVAVGNGEIVDVLPRANLAAYNISSGKLEPWAPEVIGASGVSVIDANNSGIYIGGDFTGVTSASIANFAVLDFQGKLSTKYNYNFNGPVSSLAYLNGYLFVGGGFTKINLVNRNRIAAFETATGTISSWNPNADSKVNTLFIDGEYIYVGGAFSVIGNSIRSRVAKISIKTGLADSNWDPFVGNGFVYAIGKTKNEILIGGDFPSVGGKTLKNLAAVDATSGKLNSAWTPDPYVTITNIVALDYAGKFYLDGSCGQYCNWISSFDNNSKLVSPWQPAIGYYYDTLYVEPLEFELLNVQGKLINLYDKAYSY